MITIDPIEKLLFFEGIFLKYGYDFRQYADASLERRLSFILEKFKLESPLQLLKLALDSSDYYREILNNLTIHTSDFFRDPVFFRSLREHVLPTLKTYSKLNIWIAGCSTGEELISLTIMLREEGLHERSTIYATDINSHVLKIAEQGIYELPRLKNFNKNYVAAGGTQTPSQYYSAEYGRIRFDSTLFKNVVFSQHNLATDANFIEAHLILCRNVLIYFNSDLQNRVFRLFARSLAFRGFLGIGSKETLQFSKASKFFKELEHTKNIYSLKALYPLGLNFVI